MKGTSEAKVGEALRRLGWDAYKPPDDARNQKPCDFFAWAMYEIPACVYDYNGGLRLNDNQSARCVWIEVKMERGATFPASDLRPSQRLGIARAQRLGIPYWLVIHWASQSIPTWTALELTNIDRAQVWATGLPLSGTKWDVVNRTPLVVLDGAIGAGSAEPHGQPRQAVRGGSGPVDLPPDGGRGIRPLRPRSAIPRGTQGMGS